MGKRRPGVLPLESLALSIICPYCREPGAAFVGELRERPELDCDLCGHVSPLDRDVLEQQIAELDAKRFEVAAEFERLRKLAGK